MNAVLLSALSEAISDHPLHVLQLRKIVVALAVSGRLGQRANSLKPDELLSLLEKVKASLIAKRLLPKQKPREAVTIEQLPENFSDPSLFVSLREVARVEKGMTGIQQAKPGEYPLVVTAADRLAADHFDFDGAAAIIPLVSSTGHGNASINRLHYQEGQFALGTILAAVLPFDEAIFSARFLFEYLSAFKDELLVARMSGTANVTLTLGRIEEVPVPLVPPAVQRQVDELMALCDELEAARTEREAKRDRLAAASLARLNTPDPETFRDDARFALDALSALTARPDQIKQLRQTILNLAVRGKLVSQDPADEPAEKLLKGIAAEKARLVKEKKAKPHGALPAIDLDQIPFELPKGWAWGRFPELGTFGRGKSKHRPRNDPALFNDGQHLLIQTGDVARSRGVIETYTNKYNDFGLSQSFKWPAGTLCITIAANIADSGILSFDACFPDSVVGFVPASMFENARYFEYFVRTAKANLLEFAPATAQKNINLEILMQVLVPLPPLAEQHRIVARVDELMALCDQLEFNLTNADGTRRMLLDALLAEALAPIDAETLQEAAE